MKNKLLLRIIFVIALFTACGNTQQNITKESISVDVSNLYNQTLQFISNSNTSDQLSYFDNSLNINEIDVSQIDSNVEYYISDNAFYFQFDNYMYRFQFNNEYKIDSYIRYKLEA